MTPHDLIARFDELAEAPDGIEHLRDLVVELALAGKLTAQDRREEPAALALQRIAAGLAATSKKPRRSRATDTPVGLPEGWAMAAVNDLGLVNPRNAAEDAMQTGFLPMAAIPTEWGGQAQPESRPWGDLKKGYTHVADGDVAVAKITPCFQNKKSLVVAGLANGLGAGTTELHVLRPLPSTIEARYLLLAFRSPSFIRGGVATMTGTAGQQRVSNDFFKEFLVPVPPLAEQKRIVARVDELMKLIDQLDAARTRREQARVAFRDSALSALQTATTTEEVELAWARLRERFDCVASAPTDIDSLEMSIYSLAVRGRLLPQDPRDLPANLDESPVRDAHQPFAIPASWAWARLDQLGVFGRGRSRHRPRNDPSLYAGGRYPMVQTGDVARSRGLVTTHTALYNEIGLEQSRLWPAGTFCITIAANIADVGVLQFDACFPDSVVGLIPNDEVVDARFLYFFFRTAQDQLASFAPATAQKNINLAILSDVRVPLPPKGEMVRIVNKANELLGSLVGLRAAQDRAKHLAESFAAAAVSELQA